MTAELDEDWEGWRPWSRGGYVLLDKVVDLMEALERSVAEAKAARARHRAEREADP